MSWLGLGSPPASPEVKVLEREVGFYDAGGFDPGSEDVLLGGLVVAGADPIQAVQVAGDGTQGTMGQAAGTALSLLGHPLRARSAQQGPSKAMEGMMAPPVQGQGWGWGCRTPSKSL